MENTNTIQFADDQPEWFVSVGDKYRGPFKASEVYQKLQAKELSWIDYCYREKDGQWIRLADHATFKALQPAAPKPKPAVAPPPPPKQVEETKWFLFQNEAQTGPYPTSELMRLSAAAQILPTAFVWQENFSDWKPFADVPELKSTSKPPQNPVSVATTPTVEKRVEKRATPRKPLMAQIYVTNHADLITGMCRDISVGGMQVLTDRIPGPVGTEIRLNVTPPKDTGLHPFAAEAVTVRILEDGRGFSFRFTLISDDSKRAIESYIR